MTTRRDLATAFLQGRRDYRAGLTPGACPYAVATQGALVLAYVRGRTAAARAEQDDRGPA